MSGFTPTVYGSVDLSSTVPVPGAPGVYMKSGVKLNDQMRGFAKALRAEVPFDLVITSGIRTTNEQAQAMLRKLQTGGDQAVMSLYGQKDLASEVVSAGRSLPAIQQILDRQVNRGRYISRHMRGDALDFRTRGLSSTQRLALLESCRDLLGTRNVIDEGDHVHVENLGSEWAQYLKVAGGIAILGAALVAAAGLGMLWYYRDRLRP